MKKRKSNVTVLDSTLQVVEDKDSRDRAEADLKKSDPIKPERARAVLEPDSNKKSEAK